MAKSAAPLLLVAGAAFLFMGGKKKKKTPKRSCTIVRSYEEFVAMIDARHFMPFPATVVLYPDGKSEQGEGLCRSMAKLGAATLVSTAANEAKWILDLIKAGAYITPDGKPMPLEGLPMTEADMTKHVEGVMVMFSDTNSVFTPWESIPWDDVKSILKRG